MTQGSAMNLTVGRAKATLNLALCLELQRSSPDLRSAASLLKKLMSQG